MLAHCAWELPVLVPITRRLFGISVRMFYLSQMTYKTIISFLWRQVSNMSLAYFNGLGSLCLHQPWLDLLTSWNNKKCPPPLANWVSLMTICFHLSGFVSYKSLRSLNLDEFSQTDIDCRSHWTVIFEVSWYIGLSSVADLSSLVGFFRVRIPNITTGRIGMRSVA